jgi:single-stranded DNA-binding protein
MQMLDTKADSQQNNQYSNSYDSTSNMQQGYQQPPMQQKNNTQSMPQEPTIPEIDIDEDEIPF